MKIIHTADLHLGQVIYQNYDRADEHRHFFHQLAEWCKQVSHVGGAVGARAACDAVA